MRVVFSSVLLILAMFLWGSSFIVLKLAFDAADPWAIIWLRMLVASAVGLLFLPYFPRLRFKPSQIPLLLAMAVFEPCLYFVFETFALSYTSPAQAGAITAVLPLFIGIGAAAFLGESIRMRFLLGVFVAFSGAIWLSLGSQVSDHAPRPWLGNLFEVLAMLSAAGYVLAVKQLTKAYHPWHLVLIQNIVGVLFFVPFALRSRTHVEAFFEGTLPWHLILYLGIGVSLGAFLCYTIALKFLDASKAAVFTYLIPVFAAVLSVIFLGEQLLHTQVLAIAMILLGVAFAEVKGSA